MRLALANISFLCFFVTIYTLASNIRASAGDAIDRDLAITLANYRHRFERSMNFKKLRWSLTDTETTAICEGCDLLVPEVRSSRFTQSEADSIMTDVLQMRLLIQINRSDLIDDVAFRFCKYYKLLDPIVCVGAVNEFKVSLPFICQRMC